MERAIHTFFYRTHLEVKFQQRTQKTKLALHNTIPRSSSKSQRNLNEEVVPSTATAIAKSNLRGTAHNFKQKGALT